MAIAPFLAMTAAEFHAATSLPHRIAWMACHFSPYGLGLSNLPKDLPPGSLLIVDDITPPHGHSPQLIAEQLSACVEDLHCCGVLLDFQRAGNDEIQSIAEYLTATLPCPAAVSECYARNLDCTVFLPPVPPSVALQTHLRSWKERKIWMEMALEGEHLILTDKGCNRISLPYPTENDEGFQEESLHCHYTIAANDKSARFTLWRTKEDLIALLNEAETLGVSEVAALYQEWKQISE